MGANKGQDPGATDGGHPTPPDSQGLTDLARGMQHVALCTQDILGQHFVNVINHYIDPETREALETRIRLPNGQVMDVPLFALIPPTTLALKRLKIKMAVSVNAVQVKTTQYDKVMQEVDRSRFSVSFAPADQDNATRKRGTRKLMDLEMVFAANPVPEAMNRLIEYFTQFVEPQGEADANKYGSPKNGDYEVALDHEAPLEHEAPPTPTHDADDSVSSDPPDA